MEGHTPLMSGQGREREARQWEPSASQPQPSRGLAVKAEGRLSPQARGKVFTRLEGGKAWVLFIVCSLLLLQEEGAWGGRSEAGRSPTAGAECPPSSSWESLGIKF